MIKQIREKAGFKGLLDATRGVVYESNWSPRYGKSDDVHFPWKAAMEHDKAYGQYYSFYSDKDFTPKVMRRLYDLRNESTFIHELAEYGWKKYVFGNEQINTVLLWRCDTGHNVSVNYNFCFIHSVHAFHINNNIIRNIQKCIAALKAQNPKSLKQLTKKAVIEAYNNRPLSLLHPPICMLFH